jgi:hypothetical protein
VGRWGITALPQGWNLVPNFGARQMVQDPRFILSNIALSQDPLPEGKTLPEYIEKQKEMILARYKESKFAGPQPTQFAGAEEAFMLLIRHRVQDAVDMLHVQNYIRVGDWIGIVTLTSPEEQLRAVRPDHDAFVKGLRILPPEPEPDPPAPITQ